MWKIRVDEEIIPEDTDCPYNILDHSNPMDNGTVCHHEENSTDECREDECPIIIKDGKED